MVELRTGVGDTAAGHMAAGRDNAVIADLAYRFLTRSRAQRQSGDESIIMLDAAKHGKGHELPVPRERLLQLWIRLWNPMDSLGRTRPIIVTNVLAKDTADVVDAEEDEVVQRFLPQRPD